MMASPSGKALPMDDQLAAVSGIVTPSKVPAGQKPRRPTETSSNACPMSTKICIVCGFVTTPERVKSHFVACMHANENPMGAQWWHNFVDAPKQQYDKSHDRVDRSLVMGPNGQMLGPTPQSSSETHQRHGSNIETPPASTPLMQAFAIANKAFTSTTDTTTTTEAQKFEKPNREAARLVAVNGVVVPSKVAPGNRPNQGKLIDYIPGAQDTECNICGRGFSSPSHARPHFAVCVGRNGNPYGVKWDDAFSSSNLVNFPVGQILISEHLTSKPASSSLRGPVSTGENVAQSMQQGSRFLNHSDLTFKHHRGLLPAPPGMAERELAMGTVNNAKLLDMLQAWQDVIASGQEAFARNDPGFQDVMTELEERRLIDGNWTWTVSDDQINKTYMRLVSRPKKSDQSKTVHSSRPIPP